MVKKMIVYIVLALVVFILDVEGKITIHTWYNNWTLGGIDIG
jgi:hypothetical protein